MTPRYRKTALVKVFLLASFILGCARPAHGQTIEQRAKIRGDSVLAVSRCWKPIRQLATTLPACVDSLAAAQLASVSPFARATPNGVLFIAAVGDTFSVRALVIRGYVFVGPLHGNGLGYMHSDLVVSALKEGATQILVTINGVTGHANMIVVARPAVIHAASGAPELPRGSLDSMVAASRAGDGLVYHLASDTTKCTQAGTPVPCPTE
jgi:Tfp pilus tip-associated adhesin PilY1